MSKYLRLNIPEVTVQVMIMGYILVQHSRVKNMTRRILVGCIITDEYLMRHDALTPVFALRAPKTSWALGSNTM